MANIDYGLGRTNIDTATRIRYGVISQYSLASWFFDEYQPEYGDPTCPKCGDSVADTSGHGDDEYEQYGHGCADYVCHSCRHTLDAQYVFPDEPIGHSLDTDGYKAIDCLDSDVMIVKSPFYTYAPFCSPCVPGAGNLDAATTNREYDDDLMYAKSAGVKTYCFSHDWFEDGRAPYRVFRVDDNSEVLPEAE